MTTPTDADAELRALAEKATRDVSLDVWTPTLREREDGDHDIEQVHRSGEVTQMATVYGSESFARLLVAAVNALPALLDGKAAAERERDALKDKHWEDLLDAERGYVKDIEEAWGQVATLRTSLTRAEAERDRYKALYHAERAALEAKFRAALPAQPKEGEVR